MKKNEKPYIFDKTIPVGERDSARLVVHPLESGMMDVDFKTTWEGNGYVNAWKYKTLEDMEKLFHEANVFVAQFKKDWAEKEKMK